MKHREREREKRKEVRDQRPKKRSGSWKREKSKQTDGKMDKKTNLPPI